MKLLIEQIALCPPDPDRAKQLLRNMGAFHWIEDHVVAQGYVFGQAAKNEAALSFNYELTDNQDGPMEVEILHYTRGENWMEYPGHDCSVSHLGMHCSASELEQWKAFFASQKIGVAQEVRTELHANPEIAGKRRYHYTIFDTRAILGVDLKFIVRLNQDGSPYA